MPKKTKDTENEEPMEMREEEEEEDEPEGDYESEDDEELTEGFKMPNMFELMGIPDTGDMGGLATVFIVAVLMILIFMSVFEVNMDSLGMDFGSVFGGEDVAAEMKVD